MNEEQDDLACWGRRIAFVSALVATMWVGPVAAEQHREASTLDAAFEGRDQPVESTYLGQDTETEPSETETEPAETEGEPDSPPDTTEAPPAPPEGADGGQEQPATSSVEADTQPQPGEVPKSQRVYLDAPPAIRADLVETLIKAGYEVTQGSVSSGEPDDVLLSSSRALGMTLLKVEITNAGDPAAEPLLSYVVVGDAIVRSPQPVGRDGLLTQLAGTLTLLEGGADAGKELVQVGVLGVGSSDVDAALQGLRNRGYRVERAESLDSYAKQADAQSSASGSLAISIKQSGDLLVSHASQLEGAVLLLFGESTDAGETRVTVVAVRENVRFARAESTPDLQLGLALDKTLSDVMGPPQEKESAPVVTAPPIDSKGADTVETEKKPELDWVGIEESVGELYVGDFARLSGSGIGASVNLDYFVAKNQDTSNLDFSYEWAFREVFQSVSVHGQLQLDYNRSATTLTLTTVDDTGAETESETDNSDSTFKFGGRRGAEGDAATLTIDYYPAFLSGADSIIAQQVVESVGKAQGAVEEKPPAKPAEPVAEEGQSEAEDSNVTEAEEAIVDDEEVNFDAEDEPDTPDAFMTSRKGGFLFMETGLKSDRTSSSSSTDTGEEDTETDTAKTEADFFFGVGMGRLYPAAHFQRMEAVLVLLAERKLLARKVTRTDVVALLPLLESRWDPTAKATALMKKLRALGLIVEDADPLVLADAVADVVDAIDGSYDYRDYGYETRFGIQSSGYVLEDEDSARDEAAEGESQEEPEEVHPLRVGLTYNQTFNLSPATAFQPGASLFYQLDPLPSTFVNLNSTFSVLYTEDERRESFMIPKEFFWVEDFRYRSETMEVGGDALEGEASSLEEVDQTSWDLTSIIGVRYAVGSYLSAELRFEHTKNVVDEVKLAEATLVEESDESDYRFMFMLTAAGRGLGYSASPRESGGEDEAEAP